MIYVRRLNLVSFYWQSQDIALLKDEIQRGIEWMDQLAELRDQCTLLSWHREIDDLKKCSKYDMIEEIKSENSN